MPKEMTHWVLADLFRKEHSKNSPLLMRAADKYPAFYYLGAAAYDSAFYATGRLSRWQGIADALHGYHSDDTYHPYRALAAGIYNNNSKPDELKEKALAFTAGSLAHMAADCTFHPVVFYFGGDREMQDEEARKGWLFRHRAFETALDVHISGKYEVPYGGSLKKIMNGIDKGMADCLNILSVFFTGSGWKDEVSAEDAGIILNAHVRSQELFFNGFLRALTPLIFARKSQTDADLSCLMYPSRRKKFPFFDGKLDYRNPVTGNHHSGTLSDLVHSYLELVKSLSGRLEKSLEAGQAPFQDEIGLVLDTGIPADWDQGKMYFLEPMDILERLGW
jgi:hypothetical protein